MSRLPVAAVLASFVLVFATGAEAKAPPDGFRLCGVSACVSLAGNDAETVAVSLFYGAGVTFIGPTAVPSDFYVLRWQFANQRPESGYYVGDSHLVRLFGAALGGSTSFDAAVSWLRPSPGALQVLGRLSGHQANAGADDHARDSWWSPGARPGELRAVVGGRVSCVAGASSRLAARANDNSGAKPVE